VGLNYVVCYLLTWTLDNALLALLAYYFVADLEFPRHYAQLLAVAGEYMCLGVEYPESNRKTSFVQLLNIAS